MFLGIEIGGTKLQLSVGGPAGELRDSVRAEIQPAAGAEGILQQLARLGQPLIDAHGVQRIGIGFGGPIDAAQGQVITSHQIAGWDQFPLATWCRDTFGLTTVLGNDCDCAALAEAHCGAGRGHNSVFYVTVGTGVGGGFVQHGQLMGAGRPAIAEIGHLRPGLHADQPDATVEQIASGWGIAAAAQRHVTGQAMQRFPTLEQAGTALSATQRRRKLADVREAEEEFAADLLERCHCQVDQITAQLVAQAAEEGNQLAQGILSHACQTLGWAIAQVVTLLAPEIVVIGGGVSLIGQQRFFSPVRREVARYVFPPLAHSYVIEPAALGEQVVVQGALLLAQASHRPNTSSIV